VCASGRVTSRKPSKRCPAGQRGTARVIAVKELSRAVPDRPQSRNRFLSGVKHLTFGRDLQAAEGERECTPDREAFVGWVIDGNRPVRLVWFEPCSGVAIEFVGVELCFCGRGRVVVLRQRLDCCLDVLNADLLEQSLECVRLNWFGVDLAYDEVVDFGVEDDERTLFWLVVHSLTELRGSASRCTGSR
jgi:hypothetical protein